MRLTAQDGHPVPSLMTFPRAGIDTNSPAIIHCQGGPGATPLEGSGPWIAEGLASHGYTVLAPMVRHADRLYTSSFVQMALDVKAAVDFLESLGVRDIILTGSSFGSITTTRYLVETKDPRIKANIHFAPTADMSTAVTRRLGDAAFWKAVAEAGHEVQKGDGMNTVMSVSFTHAAQVWLDLWGPASTGVNHLLFPQIKVPVLLLLGDEDGHTPGRSLADVQRLRASATASPKIDLLYYDGKGKYSVNHSLYPVHKQVIEDTVKWLESIDMGVRPRVVTQAVAINESTMGEGMRRGIVYSPEAALHKNKPAFILLHDWSGDAFRGVSQWLGPSLAQSGFTAVSINAERGQETMRNSFAASDKAIKDWADYLAGQAYQQAVAKAEAAVKNGRKDELVQFDPVPPVLDEAPLKIVMTAPAFLETWGPQSQPLGRSIAEIKVPVLLIGSPGNVYADEAAFSQLGAGSSRVRGIWYADASGGGHYFSGQQSRVDRDLLSWIDSRKPAVVAR